MRRFQLELNYLYFPPSFHLTVRWKDGGNKGKLILTKINISNVLTRRREYGTYLATARRHRRRIKMQKRDE